MSGRSYSAWATAPASSIVPHGLSSSNRVWRNQNTNRWSEDSWSSCVAQSATQRSKGSGDCGKGWAKGRSSPLGYQGKGKYRTAGKGKNPVPAGSGDRKAAYQKGEAIAGGQPVWNFAFGANINPWKLESSRGIKPLESLGGKLDGWRLVFNHRGGFGSIEPIEKHHPPGPNAVHGMLLLLEPNHFATLCQMEHQYHPTEVEVEGYDGRRVAARAFITMPEFRTLAQNLPATERYMNLIRDGARQSKLDSNYVDWLFSLPSLHGDRGPEYYEVEGTRATREHPTVTEIISKSRSASPERSFAGRKRRSKLTPTGVFVTKVGIYVADSANDTIVRFPLPPGGSTDVLNLPQTEGEVVAGGNGTGSKLSQLHRPFRIFVDDSENIFIADRNNARVVRWRAGATQGEIVAGGNGRGHGLHQLDQPSGVCVHNGNVFVADRANHRVVEWMPGAEAGVVVAGGRGFGSRPDQLGCPGTVCALENGSLIISDEANNRIQVFQSGALEGRTLVGGFDAGGGSEELYHPLGLSCRTLSNGNGLAIFVGDSLNYRVQKFVVSRGSEADEGTMELVRTATVAGGRGLGSGLQELGQPISVSVDDSSGVLYIADSGNSRILVIPVQEQERIAKIPCPPTTLGDNERQLREGIVSDFRPGGYGFVKADGMDYFAHHSDVLQDVSYGYPYLQKGQRVQFYSRQDDKWGQRATRIQSLVMSP